MKKSKQLKIWILIHLGCTLIGVVLQFVFGCYFPVLPIGSISWFFAFMLGCYSEGVLICWLYSLLFLIFVIFAYIKAISKDKTIWLLVMCVIDIVAMSMLLLFIADSPPVDYWVGVGVQIIYTIVLFVLHRRPLIDG